MTFILPVTLTHRTFTHNMHEFGLSKQLCLDFLRKQSTIANLPKGRHLWKLKVSFILTSSHSSCVLLFIFTQNKSCCWMKISTPCIHESKLLGSKHTYYAGHGCVKILHLKYYSCHSCEKTMFKQKEVKEKEAIKVVTSTIENDYNKSSEFFRTR